MECEPLDEKANIRAQTFAESIEELKNITKDVLNENICTKISGIENVIKHCSCSSLNTQKSLETLFETNQASVNQLYEILCSCGKMRENLEELEDLKRKIAGYRQMLNVVKTNLSKI